MSIIKTNKHKELKFGLPIFNNTNMLLLMMIFFSINSSSQNVFQTNTQEPSFYVKSSDALVSYLENKFKLNQKSILLVKEFETSSLTGKHITYSCKFKNVELKDFFVKIHINKQNQLFFIQENISNVEAFIFKEYTFNESEIRRSIQESVHIENTKSIYLLNEKKVFEKAYQVNFTNAKNDIYIERIYKSETDFKDRDLKVHFQPTDTIIKGSVFLPDPLTTAEQEYGENYSDAYKKDTSLIIIKTIQNTGQPFILLGEEPFTIYGYTFNLEAINVTNAYSNSEIYYVLKDLYFDENKIAIGYNVDVIESKTDKITELITEDYDYKELNLEQFEVEVNGTYDASKFYLKNDFFMFNEMSLPNIPTYNSSDNKFIFNRSNTAFEEINSFYHLNNFHNYIVSLGFNNLDNEIIRIDAHGSNNSDNSFFTNLPNPRLVFGDGGVDDAEDASVVVHEYTHALSYFASPNSNSGAERLALDEALGDYFASSYVSLYGDFTSGQVFPWDGHNEFWAGRISNSDSTYLDYDGSKGIYFNAEIMSSTLMDIFKAIGKEETDKLVLESMFYNTVNNTFQDVADNLLMIDSVLNNKKHYCQIYNVLSDRRFKEGICFDNEITTKDKLFAFGTNNFSEGMGNALFIVNEKEFKKLNYKLTNSLGKVVLSVIDYEKTSFEVSPSNFDSGVYFLGIEVGKKYYKYKLLKY